DSKVKIILLKIDSSADAIRDSGLRIESDRHSQVTERLIEFTSFGVRRTASDVRSGKGGVELNRRVCVGECSVGLSLSVVDGGAGAVCRRETWIEADNIS